MWNLKYGPKECIYKIERLTDIENRLVVAEGGGGEDRMGGIGSLGLVYANYYIQNG